MVIDVLEQLAAPIFMRKNEFSSSMKTDMAVTTRIQEDLKPTTLWEHIAQDVVYFVPQLIIVYMIVSKYAPELPV